MKKMFGYTGYIFTGFAVAAALILALYPVNVGPQTALARDIPGVETPVVTARLVEIRTIQTAIVLPVAENPIATVLIEEETQGYPAPIPFPAPPDPVVDALPVINLDVTPAVTYHVELLKEQQTGRLTLVH